MNPRTLAALLMAGAASGGGGSPWRVCWEAWGGPPPGLGGGPSREELEELLDGAPDGVREILGLPPKPRGFTAGGCVRNLSYEVKFEYTGDVPPLLDVKLGLVNALTRFGVNLHAALELGEEMALPVQDLMLAETEEQDLLLAVNVGEHILQLRAAKRHDVAREFLDVLVPRLAALDDIPDVVELEMVKDQSLRATAYRLRANGELEGATLPEGVDLTAGLGWFPLAQDHQGRIRVLREGDGPDCGPVVAHDLVLGPLEAAIRGAELFADIEEEAYQHLGEAGVCQDCQDLDCPTHPANARKAAEPDPDDPGPGDGDAPLDDGVEPGTWREDSAEDAGELDPPSNETPDPE